jgi:4-deoxy-L-threo-5-hexosulose-uronate ketol-isomerase
MVKQPDAGSTVLESGPVRPAQQHSSRESIGVAGAPNSSISVNLPCPPNPEGLARMGTAELRKCFLLENLFEQDRIVLCHTEIDRATVGGAVPGSGPLELLAPSDFRADHFAQRRELGVFNIGAPGVVQVDGKSFWMATRDAIYIGRGSRNVRFESEDGNSPAVFYFVSYPAHARYETKVVRENEADASVVGSAAQASRRTIRKYICPSIVETSQVTMGLTTLDEGSVWNTMPAHRHHRRTEIYFYFGMPEDALVLHCVGEPAETRHILVRDRQAVIAPGWSLHFGAGTSRYSFIWAMGGENREFSDMDAVPMGELA